MPLNVIIPKKNSTYTLQIAINIVFISYEIVSVFNSQRYSGLKNINIKDAKYDTYVFLSITFALLRIWTYSRSSNSIVVVQVLTERIELLQLQFTFE